MEINGENDAWWQRLLNVIVRLAIGWFLALTVFGIYVANDTHQTAQFYFFSLLIGGTPVLLSTLLRVSINYIINGTNK